MMNIETISSNVYIVADVLKIDDDRIAELVWLKMTSTGPQCQDVETGIHDI